MPSLEKERLTRLVNAGQLGVGKFGEGIVELLAMSPGSAVGKEHLIVDCGIQPVANKVHGSSPSVFSGAATGSG